MDIALYYAPIACSLVPYVTLTEANAKFEVRPVNLRKGQQNTPDYLRLNPKHKVPVLVVDGRTLTENVAIQTWIASTFPQAKLLPADPWQQVERLAQDVIPGLPDVLLPLTYPVAFVSVRWNDFQLDLSRRGIRGLGQPYFLEARGAIVWLNAPAQNLLRILGKIEARVATREVAVTGGKHYAKLVAAQLDQLIDGLLENGAAVVWSRNRAVTQVDDDPWRR